MTHLQVLSVVMLAVIAVVTSQLNTTTESADPITTDAEMTTEAARNVTAPITESPMNCFNHTNGPYVDPLNPCSNLFYVCVGGRPFRMHCPSGLFFNVVKAYCDWARNVPACAASA